MQRPKNAVKKKRLFGGRQKEKQRKGEKKKSGKEEIPLKSSPRHLLQITSAAAPTLQSDPCRQPFSPQPRTDGSIQTASATVRHTLSNAALHRVTPHRTAPKNNNQRTVAS